MPSYEQYLDDIFNHGNRTILEVAQVVGKVRIPTADEAFAGIIPIVAQGNFAEEEVTDGIRTKFLDWFHRIDDIALGFTHLVTINDKPAVTINLLRQFIPHGKEHSRPNDRMETDDFLSYKVQVNRPETVKFLFIAQEPNPREIAQRASNQT